MMKKYILPALIINVLFCWPFSFALAQGARSYEINNFEVILKINEDSTVDVTEQISYDFRGEYHQGWRSILLKNIGSITDISMSDEIGMPLEYVNGKLDKTDPASWGKYTTLREADRVNVEWYYSAADQSKTWTINYRVHGLTGFYENFDEIYWNLFTDYEVPIRRVRAEVILPRPSQKIEQSFYRTDNSLSTGYTFSKLSDTRFVFADSNIYPQEDVTVALGFDKGIVSSSAYRLDFLKTNWGLISGIIIFIFTAVYLSIYVHFNERRKKKEKTIVPQYEPPRNLKPAQMDMIYREKLSKKSWPATIVDLAVKGFVVIEEDVYPDWSKVIPKITVALSFVSLIFMIITFASSLLYLIIPLALFIVLPQLLKFILSGGNYILEMFDFVSKFKDYIIKSAKDFKSDDSLDDYERGFLKAIFDGGKPFSTKLMRVNRNESRELMILMKKIEKNFKNELVSDHSDVYAKSIKLSEKRGIIAALVFIVIIVLLAYGFDMVGVAWQLSLFAVGSILSFLIYLYFKVYNPALSESGNELWREIEGFKMYLNTAEKYRLQNLTPEIFEKFLPYAMIFGIEKKWAKNFETLINNLGIFFQNESKNDFKKVKINCKKSLGFHLRCCWVRNK